jgi:hypothetical protein
VLLQASGVLQQLQDAFVKQAEVVCFIQLRCALLLLCQNTAVDRPPAQALGGSG